MSQENRPITPREQISVCQSQQPPAIRAKKRGHLPLISVELCKVLCFEHLRQFDAVEVGVTLADK